MDLIICAVLILVLIILGIQVKSVQWSKNGNDTLFQVIIQLLIYTIVYLLMVFMNKVMFKSLKMVYFGGMILLAGGVFLRQISQVLKEKKIPINAETAKTVFKIIIISWYGLFSTLCCVNYALIVLNHDSYDGLLGLSETEKAFSTVYYTFSIMLTYSGNGIKAVDTLSQTFEMIEILVCYVIVGIVIVGIIGKVFDKSIE